MAHIRQPEQVKILFGLLYPDLEWLSRIEEAIESHWGRIDMRSEPFDFHYTHYYADEMGERLMRSWCTVKNLASPADLADWKVLSNQLEEKWSREENRIVNIDPGYICLSKLILASAKDFAQRIYLGRGIYAEITLSFTGGTFIPMPWTYPDYRDAIPMFNQWRETLKNQQRETPHG